jgi:serine/threonine protein kinase/tetratricopeptide (TPR) repeat protein
LLHLSPGAEPLFRNPLAGTNDRFDVVRRIGAGGMGVVYEAWDKQQGLRVALKTLPGLDPRALYLFKNEFRFLADVSHPNLAALYELFSDEGQWFFTMEYVDGVHLLEHVHIGWQPNLSGPRAGSVGTDTLTYLPGGDLPTERVESVLTASAGTRRFCNMDRLRSSVTQLTRALLALHGAGVVHRDLKPSNIKVTPEGRLVVLDFGLAAHTAAARFGEMTEHSGVVGTIAYMSPEQAEGGRVTEAADWYAVGVMVYEALAGCLPFEGTTRQVLLDKRLVEAPRVNLAADIPEAWVAICAGLLARDPARRMRGADLLALLEQQSVPRAPNQTRPAKRTFVGRETHLSLLREAFAASENNVPSLVLVHGKSGIGKTSLVEHFLMELTAGSSVVILPGRCYERESMPYKAFDSVVDSMARYMSGLPRHEAAELVPRDAQALAQVFPVLRQVETISSAPQRSSQVLDQHELRRKAFSALRELIARLGDRRRVVIYIDDLQWGDVDSAALLREILRPPDAPAFLFIGAYRAEYRGRSPMLDALLKEMPDEPGFERRDVLVGPLGREETRALAERLVSRRKSRDAVKRIEEIARESEGSPYLLEEIAAGSEFDAAGLTLDSVLYKRIAALPDDPHRLLETVAVSVRPLGEREALQAAGIETQDPRVPAALRAARLIRGTGGGEIEPYHDRVRETVLAHMKPAALAHCHLRLAGTLELSMEGGDRADAEATAIHFEGAGERDKASQYYAAAAERASAALAFKHAAELCQRALDLSSLSGENRRGLVVRLAEALGNAGRSAEAARTWREAARGARKPEVFELERKEAYWFASSGHVDEGHEVLLRMLRRVNVRVPGGVGRLGGIVFSELQLMLRGTEFVPRPESEIPKAALDRSDVYWDATRSFFGMVDIPAAIYVAGRCLLMALRAGEAGRIARALALYNVGLASLQLPIGGSRLPKLIAACEELTERANTPYLHGMLRLSRGLICFVQGRWLESLRSFEEAERVFSQECAGVAWELATVRIFSLWDLVYAGKYAELCERAPVWSQEGAERGDLFQTISIGAGQRPVCELIAGRPDAAQNVLDESLKRWTQRHYNMQLAIAVYIRTWIYLYRGDAAGAQELLDREWPDLRKNHYLRLSGVRQWLYSARAQSALALALTVGDSAPRLRLAEHAARNLEHDVTPLAHALARLIRAGCASLRGDSPQAIDLLRKAVADFTAVDMAMMAAAAQRRLGELQGGASGQALVEESEAAMKAEGVRDPARLTAMFANGFR